MGILDIRKVNDVPIDSPERTIMHGEVIRSKPFLKRLYDEWYGRITSFARYKKNGTFVELGSGAGFIKDSFPNVITSDVMKLPGVDKVFYGEKMPFDDDSVDAIMMIDVLHHIPRPADFFGEAQRVLKPGGSIVMSEPWNSFYGRFIYRNFHHEPFDTAAGWEIPESGPLSGANGALPWIIFERDRKQFGDQFEHLWLVTIEYHTPFRYLLSGGVSKKQLMPDFMFSPLTLVEKMLTSRHLNMFAYIVVEKSLKK
jgi:SAM-dependent methyltransferase